MNSKFCHDSEMTSRRSGIESLMMKCSICGREFSCNKTNHVYTAFLARKKLGISQTHLSNIENGRVGVTLLHLIKIKELFECPIEYFFEEKTLSENEAEKTNAKK